MLLEAQLRRPAVFPARAGMIRLRSLLARSFCSIPRESGDDPLGYGMVCSLLSIPRESGDDPERRAGCGAEGLYSPRERG